MTCIVLHRGSIVQDSRSALYDVPGVDLSGLHYLDKTLAVQEKREIYSVRLDFRDRLLGFTGSGPSHIIQKFVCDLYNGVMPLDNMIDFYDRMRELGMIGEQNQFNAVLICERMNVHVEINNQLVKVETYSHNSARFLVLGSAIGGIEQVLDDSMDTKDRAQIEPMAVATALCGLDQNSGGMLTLWRVVPETDDRQDYQLVKMGFRQLPSKQESRRQMLDLTEKLPLDYYGPAGDLPYELYDYPPIKEYESEQDRNKVLTATEERTGKPKGKRRGAVSGLDAGAAADAGRRTGKANAGAGRRTGSGVGRGRKGTA